MRSRSTRKKGGKGRNVVPDRIDSTHVRDRSSATLDYADPTPDKPSTTLAKASKIANFVSPSADPLRCGNQRRADSDERDYQIGDMVLVRTAGKPSRNATVVEVDEANGARVKINFKDKRRRGGWRDKRDLFPVRVSALDSAAATAAGDHRESVHEPGTGPAVSSAAPDLPSNHDLVPAPRRGYAPRLPDKREHDAETESTSWPSDFKISSIIEGEAPNSAHRSQRSSHQPIETTPCRSQDVDATGQVIRPTVAGAQALAATLPAISTAEERNAFSVGDIVLLPKRSGSLQSLEATVVGIDASKSPMMFKLSFEDRRHKELWRPATDLSSVVRTSPRSSDPPVPTQVIATATPQRKQRQADGDSSAEASSSGDRKYRSGRQFRLIISERTQIRHEQHPHHHQTQLGIGTAVLAPIGCGGALEIANVLEVDPSTPVRVRVAFRGVRYQQDVWRGLEELSPVPHVEVTNAPHSVRQTDEHGSRPDDTATTVHAGTSLKQRDESLPSPPSSPPPQRRGKRAAAVVAADAIFSSGSTRRTSTIRPPPRQGTSAYSGGVVRTGRNRVGKKYGPVEKAISTSSSSPASSKTRGARTPRKGWKRPKVVTPGTIDGRLECALRISHPTDSIRPRKRFKIQQSRTASKAQGESNPSYSGGFCATATTTSSRPMLRGSLCQPAHSLEDIEHGIHGGDGEARRLEHLSRGTDSISGGGSDVRRGRRVRRQVHHSLSEEMMASATAGQEDHDDEKRSKDDDTIDAWAGGGENGVADDELSVRFVNGTRSSPWGKGDKPLVKVRLSLREDGAPLSAERSALAVVTFTFDRHWHSGEQLANVLTGADFLCYCDENSKVYVLTASKEKDQKEALTRVRQLALARCGVKVDVSPWLVGRRALDEFLDNHRRVLNHIIRHRLASGLWSEVGGVYFNALFCGRAAKHTFNGVRLDINLAACHNAALQTGVWELWIAVEPVVHHFSPVDWWALMEEKHDKGLRDFSGSKSDDLERRLQVLCLPKLSKGVVYDVQEDAFETDRLQEANLKRGYIIGPRTEDEMAEYWRQVHNLSLPSSNLLFVKVLIGGMLMAGPSWGQLHEAIGMVIARPEEVTRNGCFVEFLDEASFILVSTPVLTYPSWCVVRGQAEVPEATKALRSRILDSFTDALDAMEGMKVLETTFSWAMLGGGSGGSGDARDKAPAFVTANGTVVGKNVSTVSSRPPPSSSLAESMSCGDGNDSGGMSHSPVISPCAIRTQGSGAAEEPNLVTLRSSRANDFSGNVREGSSRDDDKEYRHEGPQLAPTITPRATTGQRATSSARDVNMACEGFGRQVMTPAAAISASVRGYGEVEDHARAPSESIAASAAAQASVEAVRQSIIKRRGSAGVKRRLGTDPAKQNRQEEESVAVKVGIRLCSTPFVIRRTPLERTLPAANRVPDACPPATSCDGNSESGPSDPTLGSSVRASTRGSPETAGLEGTTIAASVPATPPVLVVAASTNEKVKEALALTRVVTPATTGNAATTATGRPEDVLRIAKSERESDTPSAYTVTFSAAGSLGVGLGVDEKEEGSMVLVGKAPTSAAASVPDGWRLTKVDGANIRGLGAGKIMALLQKRPVLATFEPTSNTSIHIPSEKLSNAAATASSIEAASAAGPSRKRVSGKQKPQGKGTGTGKGKGKGNNQKGKGRGKKTANRTATTTIRKAFKVQCRGDTGMSGGVSGGGGKSAGLEETGPRTTSLEGGVAVPRGSNTATI